jgi:DNA polymerase-3 subunit alpha
VEKTKGVKIDLTKLPLDDKKTFEMLSRGETFGVFQLSGDGMTKYLKELHPSSIFDLQAMVALYRPGPIDSIPEFIARKNNPKRVSYLDPRMKEILDQSYGVITYQDDVLLISINLAGYTWEEADKFRKAMGKKIPEEMAKQKEKFWKGIVGNGGSEKLAGDLWKLIEPFAAYGFNKAHAASYAMVAFETAYMKANFPAEYMTAIMTAESDDLEKVAEAVTECGRMGISVLPPDVGSSFKDFTYLDDGHIRFGLLAIKNIGSDTVENIIMERKENGPFVSLEDFLTRLNHKSVNRKALESLIKSGAMDAWGDRQAMLTEVEQMLAFARENRMASASSQVSLFGGAALPAATVRLPENVTTDKNDRLAWEKELLGLYVSEHPWKQWETVLAGAVDPISEALKLPEGALAVVGGVVATAKKILTKKNETMLFVKLEDARGATEVIVFPSVYKMSPQLWEPDRPIVVEGKISQKDGVPKIIANRGEVVMNQTVNRIRQDFGRVRAAGAPPAPGKIISVKIPPALSRDTVAKLRAVFDKHKGDTAVELVYAENGRERRVRTRYAVAPGEEFDRELAAALEKK